MAEPEIVTIVRQYLANLEGRGIPVSFGVLYGSHVTGKIHEWSDIDLLVVSPLFDRPFPRKQVDVLWHATVDVDTRIEPVACGEKEWEEEIKEFYEPFHKLVEEKMESVKKEDVITKETDEICDKCGKPMVIKFGRFGKFLSCTGFPDCKEANSLKYLFSLLLKD